jgi:hypothetical protein
MRSIQFVADIVDEIPEERGSAAPNRKDPGEDADIDVR